MVNSNIAIAKISIPTEKIKAFCQKNYISKLSLYGDVLEDDFTPESDIRFLFEYEQKHTPSLLDVARWEIELTELFGQEVKLTSTKGLHEYHRDEILAEAVVVYDEAG